MPKIKIEKVISFSSEDPIHSAANILDLDPSKKWRCQSEGEKSATVVLQLEKATKITSIDIGNDRSAYVEVLVNRSGADDNFKILLIMSALMTPLEARQNSNPSKVRMFSYDQLSATERDEKWDRIKIVCTQPFNKHVQYGLSFITLSSGDDLATDDVAKPQIGKFTMRPQSPIGISPGSLFAKWKNSQDDKPLSAAAAIRDASASPSPSHANSKKLKLPQSRDSTASTSRNRRELLYDENDDEPNSKIDALVEKHAKEKREREAKEFLDKLEKESKQEKLRKAAEEAKQKKGAESQKTPKQTIKNRNRDGGESSRAQDSKKRKLNAKETPNKKKKPKKEARLFYELLRDVTFSISGIQNPERANLRSMALSLGAKYKPNWENSCTHLICAVVNTPKFNQVRGRGKIVTRDWLPDCHTQRKKLPWRRYALDRNDQGRPESEDEIVELLDADTPEASDEDMLDNKSGSDTENEIERVQKQQQWKKNGVIRDSPVSSPETVEPNGQIDGNNTNTRNSVCSPNVYDCDTDVEGEIDFIATKLSRDDINGCVG